MAVTILEALENAHFNLCVQKIPGISDKIGAEQLKNAISLLEKGYPVHQEVEPLLEEYFGEIENVPNESEYRKNKLTAEGKEEYFDTEFHEKRIRNIQ